jgi:hypothetical protein
MGTFLNGIFSVFQRPIGIVALSLNHMLRNLGRALLFVFSSVSVEIAQWRHAENRVFPIICVTEHSTVRECQSM